MTLSIPIQYQDLLIGQLAALGFGGFLQEESKLKGVVEAGTWDRAFSKRLSHCLGQFRREFPRLKMSYSTQTIQLQNWNRLWEQSVGIIEPAPGIIIKPSWKHLRQRDRGKIVLHIDPKMSFGTGHHESTRLCLRLLQEYIQPQATVLDFGSGTGILAIAAVKLGAKRAVAIDNDPWTIPNIKENLQRNRIQGSVKVLLGTTNVLPHLSFDLIVANIDFPTIVNVHRSLVRRIKKGGLLLLSGLLTTDLLRIHRLIRHRGLSPLDIVEENEWAAIALVCE